ncbi:MAG: pyruvate kinase, partial [Pseudonocardiaceae bacterium]
IDLVHRTMDQMPGGRLPVIAKLEKPEAVDNLEAVVLAFDGMMVARGDLGVELPLERVPLVQKRAIQIARENAKPVIVATQMLDSMIGNSRPTRAEASDVANAVLDGADAVMLSGETSVGRYPIQSVETMSRIVQAVEAGSPKVPPLNHVPRTKRGVLSFAARDIGERLAAKALAAFTQSGDTVRRLARLHTQLPLLAFTPEPQVRSQLALIWGTETFLVPRVETTDAMVRQVDQAMLSIGRYQPGDLVVIVAGSPPATVGSTNLVRVHRLGEEDLG